MREGGSISERQGVRPDTSRLSALPPHPSVITALCPSPSPLSHHRPLPLPPHPSVITARSVITALCLRPTPHSAAPEEFPPPHAPSRRRRRRQPPLDRNAHVNAAHNLLDACDRSRRDAQCPEPEADQRERHQRLGCHLAADAHVQSVLLRRPQRATNEPEHGWVQRREPRREPRIAAIHRERVLHEVVRSDAEERHFLREDARR